MNQFYNISALNIIRGFDALTLDEELSTEKKVNINYKNVYAYLSIEDYKSMKIKSYTSIISGIIIEPLLYVFGGLSMAVVFSIIPVLLEVYGVWSLYDAVNGLKYYEKKMITQ
ncbi:hypothetical protein COX58_01750 [archaeon CG_4_10_14_0_2_um_filter_Archaea_38_6]|nr:MAG: hypothetical protein COX58_01750 [archaeon CG_4_10_14_0_2_um_filter_Archaea_38_6]